MPAGCARLLGTTLCPFCASAWHWNSRYASLYSIRSFWVWKVKIRMRLLIRKRPHLIRLIHDEYPICKLYTHETMLACACDLANWFSHGRLTIRQRKFYTNSNEMRYAQATIDIFLVLCWMPAAKRQTQMLIIQLQLQLQLTWIETITAHTCGSRLLSRLLDQLTPYYIVWSALCIHVCR